MIDRIAEDRLRILRFFRFYARFGTLPPDGEALSVVPRHCANLSVVRRTRAEILKLLAGPRTAKVVRTHGFG